MSERGSTGIGIGTVLAVLISWGRNHDILYAVLHGLLGWLYVIWWVFQR